MGIACNLTELQNESDVEQKLIAPLLTAAAPQGLGYDASDFLTKSSIKRIVIDKGATNKKTYFPDYAVIANGLPSIIIEAKAPTEGLTEAMREARLYATVINSLYPHDINPCEKIIAINGREIHFGYWDSPETTVVDCNSISLIDDAFAEFVEFSRKERALYRTAELLRLIKKTTQYYTPLQMMGGKGVAEESVGENSFGSNVSVEFKYLFDPKTTIERQALVQNAYVPSQQRASHVPQIDRLIRASVPAHLVDANLVPDTGNPSALISTIRQRHRAGELCLLIGSAGSGKSTFTDYVSTLALTDSVSTRTDWLHLNLNPAPLTRDEIYAWLVREAWEGIKEIHSGTDFETLEFQEKIYGKQLSEVKRKRASMYPVGSERYIDIISAELERLENDKELTLQLALEHLYRDQGRLLVVVLDNCDKRTKDDQLLMFEVATWLKERFHCMVFLPLRDTTYDAYKDLPPLDTVVKDLVFRIDPPRLEQVIQARLNYASRELAKEHSKFSYFTQNGIRVECAREEVGMYLSALVRSVFQNNRFKTIISGLAGRNIRKGIEILLEICKSGHIPEGEIWKARTIKGTHQFPSHLIMQILLKGKRKYYSDSETHLKNLFQSDEEDKLPDPFTRLAALTWLNKFKNEPGPNRQKGMHRTGDLLRDLQSAGFAASNIWRAVRDLSEADCILSETSSDQIDEGDLIGLSLAGTVHLGLVEDAQYLSSISEAVKFRSTQAATEIKNIICGAGVFRAESRESTIQISSILSSYLAEYYRDYHPRPEIVDPATASDYVNIQTIATNIERQAHNNKKLSTYQAMTTLFPVGTIAQGTIASVRGSAVIINLPNNVEGFIRAKSISHHQAPVPGVRMSFKVKGWNPEHSRFELSKA